MVAFLSLRELSYSMSPSWTVRRHVLRSVAVSCHCFVEMFACFKVSLSESFRRRSGRPTVLVPGVSSPNNNCFGIRSSDICVPHDQPTWVASCARPSQYRGRQLYQEFDHWLFCRYMELGGWLVDVVVGHVAVAQNVFDKASTFLLRRVVLR